jgi:hypothetical protein
MMLQIARLFMIALTALVLAEPTGTSEWVHPGPDGKLVYKTTERGDRIMDFSCAGYGGGGVAIPDVPVRREIKPSGGDDVAAIQGAIDVVSKMPLVEGFRGAVALSAGTFQCNSPITIKTSGVILRGAGSHDDGTTIRMGGTPHVCIVLGSARQASTPAKPIGEPVAITDAYVPSGASSFSVADASSLRSGDVIHITRPVTAAWVEFMGMHNLVRSGRKQTWLSGEMHAERTIKEISGNHITLDVPLSDSYDAKYLNPPSATVTKAPSSEAELSNIGAEGFRILAPAQSIGITDPQHQAVRINGVADAWLRDIDVTDTINSVAVAATSKRVTIQQVRIHHTVPSKGARQAGRLRVERVANPVRPLRIHRRQPLLFRHRRPRGRADRAAQLHVQRRRPRPAAPAVGDRVAAGQLQAANQRHRPDEPRHLRLGSRLDDRLVRRVELHGQDVSDPATAGFDELGDRMQRRADQGGDAGWGGEGDDAAGSDRIARKSGCAAEPLPRSAQGSSR